MNRVAVKLILLLCLATPTFAQSTVAVSGHARLPDGSATTNTSIQFELAGCANGQARVDGIAVFSDYKKPFPVDPATGAFSGVLYPNSAIDCNGTLGTTQYNVTVLNPRFNGQTVCYTVGPGAFVLESAQPCVTSPAIVTAAAVVVNPQGSQNVIQPPGTDLGINILAIGGDAVITSAPRMIWGSFQGANTEVWTYSNPLASIVLDKPITVTRFDVSTGGGVSNCPVSPTLSVTDGTNPVTLTFVNGSGGFVPLDSGPVSQDYAAGGTLRIVETAGSCITPPSINNVAVEYRMR